MSLRTYFLRSEFNLWRARIQKTWNDIKFSFTRRPLKSRIRVLVQKYQAFAQKYLFLGILTRWRREKQSAANAVSMLAAITRRQDQCPHLKGRWLDSNYLQRYHLKPIGTTHKDYNVSFAHVP